MALTARFTSVRGLLTAGVVAASVGAVTATPLSVPEPATVANSAVRLAAAVDAISPIVCCAAPSVDPQAAAVPASAGSTIIAAYDFLEPWVAYGFELADWAVSFVPGLWWVAPGIDLAYFTAEPVVQSLVYSFAYLIDGDLAAIGPALIAGVNEAVTNFIAYGIAWIGSLVPLPPLPPFPPLPFAASATAAPARAATVPAAEAPVSAETAADATAQAQPESATPDAAEPDSAVAAVQAPRPDMRAAAIRSGTRAADPAPVPTAAQEALATGGGESVSADRTSAARAGVARAAAARSAR